MRDYQTRSKSVNPLIATLVIGVLGASLVAQTAATVSPDRVRTVHAAAAPLDTHADVLMPTTPGIYRTADGVSQITVEKLDAGGMATVTLAIQSPTGADTAEAIAAARREVDAKLARIRELVAANPRRLSLARTSADIARSHAEGKIAVLISFQNAYALGTDVSLVNHYAAEGVRVFAFNHAGNNAFADSSRPAVPNDEPNGGLSALGRAAVQRLNDLGVVIDVSQLTPKGVRQTLELSRVPVIASHSAARALVDETRNLLDEELDAIAAKGRRRARAALQYLCRAAAAGVRGASRNDSGWLRAALDVPGRARRRQPARGYEARRLHGPGARCRAARDDR